MTRLQGKTAIVTGVSRSNGIGAAVCRAFAREGADIFFTHLIRYDQEMYPGAAAESWPDEFADELRGCGIRAEHMELDLADPLSPARLLQEAQARLGLPSILVNNATHCVAVDFKGLTGELLDDHCAVNVRGTFMLAAEFARMREGVQGGRIINLTSGQDKGPMPGNLAYAATKGAVSAFTVSLAAELAPLRITVNAVDPGPTDTGWMTEQLRKDLLAGSPMGRLSIPEDAARLIAFLASDDAEWITGQIIHSRGGF